MNDSSRMQTIQASKWRVHNDRTSQWSIFLKRSHQRKRDHVLRTRRPYGNRISIFVNDGEPVAAVDAQTGIVGLTCQFQKQYSCVFLHFDSQELTIDLYAFLE